MSPQNFCQCSSTKKIKHVISSAHIHLEVKTTLTDNHQTNIDRLRIQTPKKDMKHIK